MLAVWLCIIAASIVVIAYFRGVFRKKRVMKLKSLPAVNDLDFMSMTNILTDSFLVDGQIEDFWIEPPDIQRARIQAIQSAQRTIEFETFLFTPGRRANDFAAALIEKARKGVDIHLLIDRYGSKTISSHYWEQLSREGIQVLFFNPDKLRAPIDYLNRNHRKLLVIDGQLILIGGAGISDDWDGTQSTENKPWLDFEVSLRGEEIAKTIQGIFYKHWLRARGECDWKLKIGYQKHAVTENTLAVSAESVPTYLDSSIHRLFLLSITAAKQRIWISTPYFIPSKSVVAELINKCRLGLEIKILTMSALCDKPYVYFTARERCYSLLKAGVQIYEYQPSMMHAKAIFIDDCWSSFGSANLDYRSLFHNDELNISGQSDRLNSEIKKFFYKGFSKSNLITVKTWENRPLSQKIIGMLISGIYWQL